MTARAAPPRRTPHRVLVEDGIDADFDEIAAVLLDDLRAFYDDVEPSLVKTITRAACGDLGGASHFTSRKRIFTAYADDCPVGFTVATWKRGGAVKTGPTVILPQYRRRGHARWLKQEVNARLFAAGARKLFSTVAADNWCMLLLSLQLDFEVEGILSDHYRSGGREVVLGRFAPRSAPGPTPAAPTRHLRRSRDRHVAQLVREPDARELSSFILPRLAHAYADLDDTLIEAIVGDCAPGRREGQSECFVVAARGSGGQLSAVGVGVAKRGGALKICPLVAEELAAAENVIDHCIAEARVRRRRKIYATVPLTDVDMTAVLRERDFAFEAMLREPYKAGVDAMVLSRMIDG